MGEIGDGVSEGTCRDEPWMTYGSVESLYCTPDTNIPLHANQLELKQKLKNKSFVIRNKQ